MFWTPPPSDASVGLPSFLPSRLRSKNVVVGFSPVEISRSFRHKLGCFPTRRASFKRAMVSKSSPQKNTKKKQRCHQTNGTKIFFLVFLQSFPPIIAPISGILKTKPKDPSILLSVVSFRSVEDHMPVQKLSVQSIFVAPQIPASARRNIVGRIDAMPVITKGTDKVWYVGIL